MSTRPALRALADRLGILAAYVGHDQREVRTSDATRTALLTAMGVDASTEATAARALRVLEREAATRLLPPVRTIRESARSSMRVPVTLPPGSSGRVEWALEVRDEQGAMHRADGRLRPRPTRTSLALPLPGLLPHGYHRLRVTIRTHGTEHTGEQDLIVVPATCLTAAERLGGRRTFGLCTNLYTLRSQDNWGIGDVGDLRALVDWSSTIGAAFVGINPLHALGNTGVGISPYSPVSRLFGNVLYLDVTAIPELAESAEARARLASPECQAELARLRATRRIDYAAVLALKRAIWDPLHRTFVERHRERETERGRAYRRFCATQGQALVDFATFLALQTFCRGIPTAPYGDPRSPEVRAFRAAHPTEVDLHCYLQFELDRQLAETAERARAHDMPIGLYQDLAMGSAPSGSDRWAFPELFLDAVNVGAPPDAYSAVGQDWGLPPVDPRRLTASGYRYWILLLRNALAHVGALRIDHVAGLFRQYWIPAGQPGTAGAYVRFPLEDLLGILALESRRAGALVVGEDLGTVPRGLRRVLARWGLLSSRVLYFERTKRGSFHGSSRYPDRALVTANTHDMVPLAGFWQARDLELGRATGGITSDEALDAARRERARTRRALLRRLAAEGILPDATEPPSPAALRGAVHAFLCRTRAALVGLSLDDLVGEVEPVNLPGVRIERYPSWSRRLAVSVESLARDPDVRVALAGTRARAWPARKAR